MDSQVTYFQASWPSRFSVTAAAIRTPAMVSAQTISSVVLKAGLVSTVSRRLARTLVSRVLVLDMRLSHGVAQRVARVCHSRRGGWPRGSGGGRGWGAPRVGA